MRVLSSLVTLALALCSYARADSLQTTSGTITFSASTTVSAGGLPLTLTVNEAGQHAVFGYIKMTGTTPGEAYDYSYFFNGTADTTSVAVLSADATNNQIISGQLYCPPCNSNMSISAAYDYTATSLNATFGANTQDVNYEFNAVTDSVVELIDGSDIPLTRSTSDADAAQPGKMFYFTIPTATGSGNVTSAALNFATTLINPFSHIYIVGQGKCPIPTSDGITRLTYDVSTNTTLTDTYTVQNLTAGVFWVYMSPSATVMNTLSNPSNDKVTLNVAAYNGSTCLGGSNGFCNVQTHGSSNGTLTMASAGTESAAVPLVVNITQPLPHSYFGYVKMVGDQAHSYSYNVAMLGGTPLTSTVADADATTPVYARSMLSCSVCDAVTYNVGLGYRYTFTALETTFIAAAQTVSYSAAVITDTAIALTAGNAISLRTPVADADNVQPGKLLTFTVPTSSGSGNVTKATLTFTATSNPFAHIYIIGKGQCPTTVTSPDMRVGIDISAATSFSSQTYDFDNITAGVFWVYLSPKANTANTLGNSDTITYSVRSYNASTCLGGSNGFCNQLTHASSNGSVAVLSAGTYSATVPIVLNITQPLPHVLYNYVRVTGQNAAAAYDVNIGYGGGLNTYSVLSASSTTPRNYVSAGLTCPVCNTDLYSIGNGYSLTYSTLSFDYISAAQTVDYTVVAITDTDITMTSGSPLSLRTPAIDASHVEPGKLLTFTVPASSGSGNVTRATLTLTTTTNPFGEIRIIGQGRCPISDNTAVVTDISSHISFSAQAFEFENITAGVYWVHLPLKLSTTNTLGLSDTITLTIRAYNSSTCLGGANGFCNLAKYGSNTTTISLPSAGTYSATVPYAMNLTVGAVHSVYGYMIASSLHAATMGYNFPGITDTAGAALSASLEAHGGLLCSVCDSFVKDDSFGYQFVVTSLNATYGSNVDTVNTEVAVYTDPNVLMTSGVAVPLAPAPDDSNTYQIGKFLAFTVPSASGSGNATSAVLSFSTSAPNPFLHMYVVGGGLCPRPALDSVNRLHIDLSTNATLVDPITLDNLVAGTYWIYFTQLSSVMNTYSLSDTATITVAAYNGTNCEVDASQFCTPAQTANSYNGTIVLPSAGTVAGAVPITLTVSETQPHSVFGYIKFIGSTASHAYQYSYFFNGTMDTAANSVVAADALVPVFVRGQLYCSLATCNGNISTAAPYDYIFTQLNGTFVSAAQTIAYSAVVVVDTNVAVSSTAIGLNVPVIDADQVQPGKLLYFTVPAATPTAATTGNATSALLTFSATSVVNPFTSLSIVGNGKCPIPAAGDTVKRTVFDLSSNTTLSGSYNLTNVASGTYWMYLSPSASVPNSLSSSDTIAVSIAPMTNATCQTDDSGFCQTSSASSIKALFGMSAMAMLSAFYMLF